MIYTGNQLTGFYMMPTLTFNPANTLRKSNVILSLYFGNLRKLLSANVDVT